MLWIGADLRAGAGASRSAVERESSRPTSTRSGMSSSAWISRSGMMSHHRHAGRVQADASILPFPDAVFDVIVIGDGPLFAAETVRLLARGGALVWSNALGSEAPYFQRTEDIWDALTEADPRSSWSAVRSDALWGSWVVFRRGVSEHR